MGSKRAVSTVSDDVAVAVVVEEPDARKRKGQITRERILGVATRLFAEQGYNGVSLRQVCQEAEVNLALMSYHFGTKEKLLLEIFQRGTGLINAERERLIAAIEDGIDGREPPIETVLAAFIEPTLKATTPHDEEELHFLRLSGRLATDPTPEVRRVMASVYDTVATRFVRLLRRCCAHLDEDEFFMRLVFFYGAMLYTRADTGRVLSLAGLLKVKLAPATGEDAARMMVPFLAAGFTAPATRRATRRRS